MQPQVTSGSGLAFVAISEAVSRMNAPYVWAILFFSMLILLGLDSEFGTLEGAVTPLVVDMNLFPKIRKEIVSAVFAAILFVFGIGFCSGGGEYMIIVFDTYGKSLFILIGYTVLFLYIFFPLRGYSVIFLSTCFFSVQGSSVIFSL